MGHQGKNFLEFPEVSRPSGRNVRTLCERLAGQTLCYLSHIQSVVILLRVKGLYGAVLEVCGDEVLKIELLALKDKACLLKIDGFVIQHRGKPRRGDLIRVPARLCPAQRECILVPVLEETERIRVRSLDEGVRVANGSDHAEADVLSPEDAEASPLRGHGIEGCGLTRRDQHSVLPYQCERVVLYLLRIDFFQHIRHSLPPFSFFIRPLYYPTIVISAIPFQHFRRLQRVGKAEADTWSSKREC